MLKGVEQPRQFGEQSLVRVLKPSAPVKRLRQVFPFAIEIDAPENRLSAGLDSGQVLRDPVRRHLTIRVGGQDYAAPSRRFPQATPLRYPSRYDGRCQRARSPGVMQLQRHGL